MTKQGSVQDANGFVISNGASNELEPALAASGTGQFACFYQRYVSTFDAIRVRGRLVKLP